jgi:hypothetical protein
MRCPHCGSRLNKGTTYCNICGKATADPKRKGRRALLALLVFALIAALGAGGFMLWRGGVLPSPPPDGGETAEAATETPTPTPAPTASPTPQATATPAPLEAVWEEEPPAPATATRAQWVQALVAAAGYGTETGEESFFTDVAAGSAEYGSVQTAAAYGFVDYGEGLFCPDGPLDLFRPGDPATREFVAVTSARALGLSDDPEAALRDIADSLDPESIRRAVDIGLFDCPDGLFDPAGAVTVEECLAIAEAIRSYSAGPFVDPGHEDAATLREGVADLRGLTDPVNFADGEAMSVTVSPEAAAALEIGSVYILPPTPLHPYGVARKVEGIERSGDSFTVTNSVPRIGEVADEIDVQGTYYPDYGNIWLAEGVVWDGETSGETLPGASYGGYGSYALREYDDSFLLNDRWRQNPLRFNGERSSSILKGDGYEVSGTLAVYLSADVYVKKDPWFGIDDLFGLEMPGDVSEFNVTVNMKQVLSIEAKIEKGFEVSLAVLPIPIGETGIVLLCEVSLDASGEIVLSIVHEMHTEFAADYDEDRPRRDGNGRRRERLEMAASKTFSSPAVAEIEGSAKIGLKPSVKVDFFGLELVEVHAFIGPGIAARASTAEPCRDVTLYLALSVGATAFPQLESDRLTKSKDIWTEGSSLFRKNWHFERGRGIVGRCSYVEFIGREAVGTVIEFGGYEWRVLDVRDGKALLLSEYILDHRRYHRYRQYDPYGYSTETTWADCDLRAYLNGEFYNRFGEGDRARIARARISNKDNQWYGTDGGKDTDDYVFLLSLEEVVRYFGDSGQLANMPSEDTYWLDDQYSGARCAYCPDTCRYYRYMESDDARWYWWLRSPGEDSTLAAFVWIDGRIKVEGTVFDLEGYVGFSGAYTYVGVRPAMWVSQ